MVKINVSDIETRTGKLVENYLAITGRGKDGNAGLSVNDFLLLRQEAIMEIKEGVILQQKKHPAPMQTDTCSNSRRAPVPDPLPAIKPAAIAAAQRSGSPEPKATGSSVQPKQNGRDADAVAILNSIAD